MSDYRLNPYLALLAESQRAEFDVVVGVPSLRTAVMSLGASLPDVLHLHWEGHWIARRTRSGSVLGFLRLALLVVLARLRGRRVIWTVHNVRSHDSPNPDLERLLQAALARVVSDITVHSESGRRTVADHLHLDLESVTVVHHGAYGGHPSGRVPRDTKITFLTLGLLRPYKRLVELVESVAACDTDVRLVISGPAIDDAYSSEVERAASQVDGIDLRLGEQDDSDLADLFASADVFLLGAQGQLTSGSAILAASYGVPVMAPRSSFLDDTFGPFYLAGDPTEPEALDFVASKVGTQRLEALAAGAFSRVKTHTFDGMASGYAQAYLRTSVPIR
ncbi:MAG: hypothetical protein OSA99_21440 [Acidimicrobiales bacterium]|nr:hypothetical protein [Acidimicrobiales bacterium]